MNELEKIDFEDNYNESGFWEKIKKYAKVAGAEVVEKVLIAYYCAKDPDTPLKAKSTIFGSLAYFIVTVDVIPDPFVGVGFTDDLAILVSALAYVAIHIKKKHKKKAKQQVKNIFG